jgi:predicted aminopeptidase
MGLWFLSLCGCRPGYVLHAAKGQFELLSESIPVEDALKDETLSPTAKQHLALVPHIKSFGEQELGLKSTDSYTTAFLKPRSHSVYTVAASPKDALERMTWWFPVVGKVPYLGFFDIERARKEKHKLEQRDMDVTMGKASAYSTLGWFKDPVTLDLLEGSTADFVEVLLHEMTHTTIYLSSQAEFNEGLALLIGKWGALRFAEQQYGDEHPVYQELAQAIDDERLFSAYISSLMEALHELYASSMTREQKVAQRDTIFLQAQAEFQALQPRFQTRTFDYFATLDLNNASLLAIALYHQHYGLFEKALEKNRYDIRSLIHFFREMIQTEEDVLSATREWLSQTQNS